MKSIIPYISKNSITNHSNFKRSNLVIFAAIFAAIGGYLIYSSFAASVTLTIDGNTHYQTMDGFGVNANSASWAGTNGSELTPTLDMLADGGSTIWRVVVDDADWEATNDDSDPNHFNWTYYNSIYTNPKFEKLWSTIAYLNQKPNSKVILCPMGKGPSWLGGLAFTDNATNEAEYAEMITSMAYYGHITRGLQFVLEPNNEPDIQYEGIRMSNTVYASTMNKVAQALDANGMSDMEMMGSSAGVSFYNVTSYSPQMWNYPTLMAHIKNYSLHDYNGTTSNADSTYKSSPYPDRHFYMTEFAQFIDGMAELDEGPTGMLVWDGYDSAYLHPLDHGSQFVAPNDASSDGPALFSYNSTNHTYSPRKEYYQFKQLFKYVPPGSVRVGASGAGPNETIYAFYHQATGRITIVGQNTNSTADTIATTINNLPSVPAFEYYTTTASNNFVRGADIPVSGNTLSFTAPANSIYTLTYSGTPDTSPPSVSITSPSAGATVSGVTTVSAIAADDVGVTGVQFKLDGTNIGSEDTSAPYSASWGTGLISNGTHTLTAVARDSVGNTTTSAAVSVNVFNAPDTTPPTVSISNPTNGSSVSGTTTVAANANDNTGVAGVQFMLDGNNLQSEDTTSPYSITWDTSTTANGSHTLTAAVRDAAGNTTTSPAVTVTIANTGVLVGNNNIQTASDSNTAGDAEAFKYTAASSGTSGNLSLYVAGGTATSIKVGLYSDNNGHPGNLLGSGTINSPTISAWNSTTLSPSVNISSGTIYWIAFVGIGGSTGYRDQATGNCSESYSTAGQTTLPATWASGTSWPSCQLSAYITAASSSSGPKAGDIDGDNSVNITDLSLLLSSYGQTTTKCITNNVYTCDLTTPADGVVNIFDLSILLSHYGT
jgi:hypothetical protein